MNPQVQRQDIDHLNSLAIGFRVVGGLCALCVNIAWIHVFVGLATMFGFGMSTASSNARPSDSAFAWLFGTAFGGLFAFIGLFVILAGYAMGYYGFRAAKALELHREWKLCFGVSIAFLLFQPLGLVVGILALIVLNRPSVRDLFNANT